MGPRLELPVRFAPSILSADFGKLTAEIKEAAEGGADYIHLDVMDGRFVPNISFGPRVVEVAREATELPLDVHLMIAEPERYLKTFAHAGASILTVHSEATVHLHRAVEAILDLGCRACVALNPATPIETLREVAPILDQVLIMSVNPGFGGQRFIETATSKLRRTRRLLDEFNPMCEIEVDGGIHAGNVRAVVRNGANVVVAGSAVFRGDEDVAGNIAALRAQVNE